MKDIPVTVVGGGPTGLLAANLLGRYHIKTQVLEKKKELSFQRRAVLIDDEGLRILQNIDLLDQSSGSIHTGVPLHILSSTFGTLYRIVPTANEKNFGHYRLNTFLEPVLESNMMGNLKKYPHVHVIPDAELISFREQEDGLLVQYKNQNGEIHEFKTQILLGCDGEHSTVRKLIGEKFNTNNYCIKWLTVETEHDFLPTDYIEFHCNPERPAICYPLPMGHRRWEFMVLPGEDEASLLQTERIHQLLNPWIGDRTPDISHRQIYNVYAKTVDHTCKGRVVLLGNAARMIPTFAGQGVISGFKDVLNVIWKVVLLIKGKAGKDLLNSYDNERGHLIRHEIQMARMNLEMLTYSSNVMALLRDSLIKYFNNSAIVNKWLFDKALKPTPKIPLGKNSIVVSTSSNDQDYVGQLFIQPSIQLVSGERKLLDDCMGPYFTLLGWNLNPLNLLNQDSIIACQAMEMSYIQIVSIDKLLNKSPTPMDDARLVRVIDVYGDLEKYFKQIKGIDFVLLRPDRFVGGMASSKQLNKMIRSFQKRLVF
ncbi:MAG: FAD-dependent monooxygenase [SAR324 cluster bacterium]|nr:FAD-dependent monooxygenase [SAR324 cluster bacterium]